MSRASRASVLEREEYVEQAYLFRGLADRTDSGEPIQELLKFLREEILATTKLPHAIGYLLAELSHVGTMASAMSRIPHYFTAFQSCLIGEAESEKGRFDMNQAFVILEREARMRSESINAVSLFFFQFETICRHRLNYDRGLAAMSADPVYDQRWAGWLLDIRHKIGIVDIADLVYVHSEYYQQRQQQTGTTEIVTADPVLFGVKEGRVALANRNKETLYFFSALQRQLGYPQVPRPQPRDAREDLIPKLSKQMQQFDVRLKLLEEEQRSKGIDLSQFYADGQNRD